MITPMTDVSYQFDHRFPITVMRLWGELTVTNASMVRDAALEALVEEPTSMIIDLTRVESADEPALQFLPGVAAQAAAWPGTSLLVCAPPGIADSLTQISEGGFTVHPSFAAALSIAAADPVPLRMHQRLEPTVHAPRAARELAAEACAAWDLPRAVVPAEIIASELVTNAVRHAGTTIDLRITHREEELRISVQDRDPALARLRAPSETDDHGRGLLIVDSVAHRWGCEPVGGGKVVWAAVQVSPQPAEDLVGTPREPARDTFEAVEDG